MTSLACTLVACPGPQGGQFANLIEGRSSLAGGGNGALAIESSEGKLILRR